jgi:hypothetical protein
MPKIVLNLTQELLDVIDYEIDHRNLGRRKRTALIEDALRSRFGLGSLGEPLVGVNSPEVKQNNG